MPSKSRLILAVAIFVFGMGIAVFYFLAPRPAEVADLREATQPARVERQPAASATPAPTDTEKATTIADRSETSDVPLHSASDNTPLLLILAIIVAAAGAALIFRGLIRGKRNPALASDDLSILVAELQNIACKINSWTLDDDRKTLDRLNRDARRIGQTLYRQGGMERMLSAHRLAGSQRVIESAWDGVGTWRG
jgi:hypothetical protein